MKARATAEGSLLWREWMWTCGKHPKKIVVIDAVRDVTWTAETLTQGALEYSERLANFLPGSQIAFCLPNGPDWMAFFLALQRANLAAVPLDAGMPQAGRMEVARRIGARAVYDGENFLRQRKAIDLPGCCGVKVTSGSDGTPKTIACRAEHLLADGRQVVATMKIRPRDRNLAVIPLGHSYGLGNLVMPLIQQGTALVTADEYVPRQLAEWIPRYGVTVLPLVPALLRALAGLPPDLDLAPVRTVISAGAVLSPETAQAFFQRSGRKIHNFYGSSETGGIAYDRTGGASLTGRSVGKPLVSVSIVVKSGQITVKSRAVATRTGRWKLSDLGEWNERGELKLLGRVGQEANIGGKKVHPREIEIALRSMRGVTDAAVWLSSNHGRDYLVAAVETKLTRAGVEKALAGLISAWKLPKKYLVAAELPRTARGKLDAAELRRQLGSS